MKYTIDEYSKHFKMSKEMIKSKLKAKKLNYITEDNIVYITTEQETSTQQTKNLPIKAKPTVATILSLYQKENQQLKDKIVQLENKIDKLIDDKEQMLRDEMRKIEQVYSAKDEQLKTILELVNTKLLMNKAENTVHEVEAVSNADELIEYRKYIKTLDTKSYQRKIIRQRFLAAKNDERLIKKNGQIFLNLAKYDYSDLIKY